MYRLLIVFIIFISTLFATETESKKTAIFIECRFCNEDFIKEEIPYVDYVRDRLDADIHVMETSQQTGSGGDEYSLYFIGQSIFSGKNDTLSFTTSVDDTKDQIRKERVRVIQIGLVPYLLKTSLASLISVDVASVQTSPEKVEDKWNNWVFKIRGNSFMNAQQSSRSVNVFGTISASRVTEDWKIQFRPFFNYNYDRFERKDETIESTSRRDGFTSYVVRSISPHWSIGTFGDAFTSTFANVPLRYRLMPAIEWSLYPYREATRRQLTVAYRIGASHIQYRDTTIYNETVQLLPEQTLSAGYEVTQPWGEVDVGVNASQYLHDLRRYSVRFDGAVDVRIAQGIA